MIFYQGLDAGSDFEHFLAEQAVIRFLRWCADIPERPMFYRPCSCGCGQ